MKVTYSLSYSYSYVTLSTAVHLTFDGVRIRV